MEKQIALVLENIAKAATANGRLPEAITLVAATKTQTSDTIRAAIAAGIKVCGENRVQELQAHLDDHAYEGAAVHFIGHLQTNKVKQVVGHVDLIESVDSQKLLNAIDAQAEKMAIVQDVLLEVNIASEENKGGAAPNNVLPLAQYALTLPNIRLRGLMCIPPADASETQTIAFFEQTQKLFVDMVEKIGHNNPNIDCLSMGMSGDYPLAVAAGATMVRVGTALFGARAALSPKD
ncbi:MAG: YggS family pyridoxal phosphate-dependent enzyme [Evtepia sp.]